jgi:hypothetical protein
MTHGLGNTNLDFNIELLLVKNTNNGGGGDCWWRRTSATAGTTRNQLPTVFLLLKK